MIIFAGKQGYGNEAKYLNDIYAFDFEKQEWVDFKTKNTDLIEKRCWHTCTFVESINSSIILFGGFKIDNSREIYFNDTWILDLNSLEWKKVHFELKNCFPHERNRHIAIHMKSFSNNSSSEYILIHSGNYLNESYKDIWLEDLFLLEMNSSLNEFKWIKLNVETIQDCQMSRSQHTAEYINHYSEILCFGGEHSRKRFNDIISIKILL